MYIPVECTGPDGDVGQRATNSRVGVGGKRFNEAHDLRQDDRL